MATLGFERIFFIGVQCSSFVRDESFVHFDWPGFRSASFGKRVILESKGRNLRNEIRASRSDETFVGGQKKNMHADKKIRYEAKGGASGKTVVQGILDRDARQVRAKVRPT